ncbi:unnamed protein product, partial [Sphacelaria rigidula]
QAEKALLEGEVPVGCVIVNSIDGRVVSSGHNQTNAFSNVSRNGDINVKIWGNGLEKVY